MKKLIYLGTFALLTTTLFSCTADEYETADKKTEIKKENLKNETQATEEGPGDDPVPIKPPKK
ncbi:hypothetical protein [Flavobacterium poyangense]|uniref:hypothetical protein n=1 Tax=Flavobacterium poyangense TaxID=2204302 RepID=UPI00141E4DAC|nr:hypothetical protein [Flavobacterium sp. JXAS1]